MAFGVVWYPSETSAFGHLAGKSPTEPLANHPEAPRKGCCIPLMEAELVLSSGSGHEAGGCTAASGI